MFERIRMTAFLSALRDVLDGLLRPTFST